MLGSYLIRDLLCAGTQLAVLARPNRMAGARMRIESQMVRWEKQLGRALPRPVVWEGDITQPDLGIGARGVEWVARNVTSLMHNAASLTFHAESADSEPWISNVEGTKNVLEFCRKTDVRRYFHVSTAYVAGLRTGRVMESELDVGQEPGNDYEASKIQSEKLVRSAEFIEELTVFRPGIILGDSKDGYTATFHGFYVPLQLLAAGMKKSAGMARTAEELEAIVKYGGDRLVKALAMKGDEGKYFVPVDWVSAAMSAVFLDSSLHGETYHLTPAEPVSIALVQQVIGETNLHYTPMADDDDPILDFDAFEKTFFEGMSIYKSYWRNDPQFDCTNITKALPHLPCPPVDREMLHVMCRFAMDSNFGWPREPIVTPEFDVHDHLQPFTTAQPEKVPSGTEEG
ncbi:MAG: SDR family oxidoreductase, partial [Planctomycetes bacterium]|nr:SDR family oxidoreductase [Planctomycetota bacterium]